MQAAPRYNRWQCDRVAPFLGRPVCEVGSGIGNMSASFLVAPPELLVLTDTDPYYREALQQRFAERQDVVVKEFTLPEHPASPFQELRLDTAVALNVIGHIAGNVEALGVSGTCCNPSAGPYTDSCTGRLVRITR
jgi:hypothetical protein